MKCHREETARPELPASGDRSSYTNNCTHSCCGCQGVVIENYRPCDRPPLMAFCSLCLGGVAVHDCRILRGRDSAPFLALPERVLGDSAERRYIKIVGLSRELYDAAQKATRAFVASQQLDFEEPAGGDVDGREVPDGEIPF